METEDTTPPGRARTQTVINLANVVDYADAQVDIATYSAVEVQFGLSTTELGAITAVRAILQSVATPFWGILSDKYSRRKILAFGTLTYNIFLDLIWISVFALVVFCLSVKLIKKRLIV